MCPLNIKNPYLNFDVSPIHLKKKKSPQLPNTNITHFIRHPQTNKEEKKEKGT